MRVAVKAGKGSGLAAWIVGLEPVLTAVWVSWMGSGEGGPTVSKRQWIGLALGFGGLMLVVSRKFGSGHEVTLLTLSATLVALIAITAGPQGSEIRR